MELEKLNRANEIIDNLERIKRVMPSFPEHKIDESQAGSIVALVMQHEKEFCQILTKQVERLEKEFNEL